MRFRRKDPPQPGQKGWSEGNESLRAEEARQRGLRTADEIAKAYGIPRDVIEGSLRWAEWHHVLKGGKKTPDMVHFYDFDPKNNEDDADKLREMQEQRGFRQITASYRRRMTLAAKRHGLIFKFEKRMGMGEFTRQDGTRVAVIYGYDDPFLEPKAGADQRLIWQLEDEIGLMPGSEKRDASEYYERARKDAAQRHGLEFAGTGLYRGETMIGSHMTPSGAGMIRPAPDASTKDIEIIDAINEEVGTYPIRSAKELLAEFHETCEGAGDSDDIMET